MKLAKVLQPGYFDAFHCIGPDCEDTCCTGWIVNIDRSTYGKYQEISSQELETPLRTLITINEQSSSDDDYARVTLNGAVCPFLSEGLCSIQQRLGEAYLSDMCAIFPRVMNRVGEVLRRSLDLSCPEAARVILLNPEPIEFQEQEHIEGSIRLGNVPALDTSNTTSPDPCRLLRDVQRRVISVLQDRSRPIWKRLLAVGRLCQEGDEADAVVNDEAPVDPEAQLGIVLELIVARISSDSNPRRFLECYQEFMSGIQWTSRSTMKELAARYVEAYSRYYVGLMSRHEYILEHFLVNYVHRTLFPAGLAESNRRVRNDRVSSPATAQYMLMTAYYAIIQTLLIGMAGFHKADFGTGHVIKLIQSCAKTFEHSVTYPGQAIAMLADKGMTTPAALCPLMRS